MTDALKLGPQQDLTIVEERPERLLVEVHWQAATGTPPSHLHPQQDERFEVLEGTLHAVVGGEERAVGPGDTLVIPRGTPHQMWAPAGAVRARWETAPAGRTGEWFRHLDGMHRSGDFAPLPALLAEYRDVFVLAGA